MKIIGPGHLLFALSLIGVGLWGLASGHFNGLWPGVPKSFPQREVLAYVCGAAAVAGGLGLLLRRTGALAAGLLTVIWLVWDLAFRGPAVVHAPLDAGIWDGFGITAMLAITAWALFAELAQGQAPPSLSFAVGDSGLRIVRILYGLVLIDFGIAHFGYLTFTASLVPAYLPDHVAWAEGTGLAYMAAGLAVLSGVLVRLAATLAIVQIAGFTVLVWAPILAGGKATFGDWSEGVVSLVLTAAAWVLADTYRGAPWFELRTRQAAAIPA